MKTAIVTGASSGIGFAITRELLGRGYAVVGNALSGMEAASEAFGAGDRFVPLRGDIGSPETGKRLFDVALERFDHVDVLVNNAGVFIGKPTVDFTVEDVAKVLGTNNGGAIYAGREKVRHYAQRECMRGASSVAFVRDQDVAIPTLALAQKSGR